MSIVMLCDISENNGAEEAEKEDGSKKVWSYAVPQSSSSACLVLCTELG